MGENKIYPKVFMWMFIGLLVTFGVGAFVSANENMVYNIFQNSLYFWLVIAQLVVVIVLSARLQKMKESTATILFILYSALTGLTFSSVFICFELESIMMVFGVTAIIFAIFACLGYFTKIDLTKWSTFLLMALLGIVIVSIINIFLANETVDLALCCLGIIVFVAYVAYDMQKIKLLQASMGNEHKVAIIGALELYLDFINLFLRILELIGKNRD